MHGSIDGAAHRANRRLAIARNSKNKMGGFALLRSLQDYEATLVHFDPQYRGILDAMDFGNVDTNTRLQKRIALPQMTNEHIAGFIEESARVLAGSGHLLLWIDKFMLGGGRHLRLLARAPTLAVVDIIAWNKDRIGMGRRSRCSTEYLVIAQKYPLKATWSDRGIPDCWTEKPNRKRHPHEKPAGLIERLVKATTRAGDLVVDPCAGSYTMLEVCQRTGREFIGCDLI